jgi:hypothetical protein
VLEAAALLAASLWLSPAGTPFDLALPLGLVALAALAAPAPAIDTPEPPS